MVDVSIVIPTHNRAALLARTLRSLADLEIPSGVVVEVVVVANACTDETLDVVRQAEDSLSGPVQVVEESRAGLNLARSRGLAAARADLVAFFDDDVWVERGWLEALTQAAGHLPAQLFAGRVVLEWETCRPSWASPAVERLLSVNDLGDGVVELARSSQLVGANFAIRRSVVETVGDFARALDRRGTELLSGGESDLVKRALAAGHRLFYVPGMAVRHWIPRQRATVEHLEALAFGRGRTRVALRAGRGPHAFACAQLGAAQTLLGGLRELSAWRRRDDTKRIEARLLRQRGMGALFALWRARIDPREEARG